METTKKIIIALMAIVLMTLGNISENGGGAPSAFAAITTPFSQDGIGSSHIQMRVNGVEGTTFTDYQNWPSEFTKGSSSFAGGVFDGENVWMIPYNADHLVKINSTTGEMTAYNNWPAGFTKGSNAFAGAIFDGTDLWLIPFIENQVIQVNGTTGEMTGYSNWPEGSRGSDQFVGGSFDGTHIWLTPYSGSRLIKLDTRTGEMAAYSSWPNGTILGSYPFYGSIFDGTDIWLIPNNADRLIKIDPSTGDMTGYNNWPSGFTKSADAFSGGTFDGTNIWLIPSNATHVLKIDTTTGDTTGYANWPEGFTKGSGSFAGGVFDGENIWMIPSNSSSLVKVNASTGVMTSHNNWPTGFAKGNNAFLGGVYDGENIWMIPFMADRVLTFGSNTTIDYVHLITDIHVPVSADNASVHLPLNVDVSLNDMTTTSLPVVWDSGDPIFDANTPGDYEFTGDLTLPPGVMNPQKITAEIKIIVSPAIVAEVAQIADIRVQNGTDLTRVSLPSTIAVTLTDKTTENVSVNWDGGTPAYNSRKAGTYRFQGQLDTQIGNPDGVIAEVNVIVRPRPTPPPINIQSTLMANQTLTEEQLDGSTITVNVSDTNFMMSLAPEYFTLQNAPAGLTIREVQRISSSQTEITLAFDGTRLEQDYDLGLMIHNAALTNGYNIVTNNSLTIQRSDIPYKVIVKEGTFEPTKVWTVKLSHEVEISTVQDALYIVDAEGNPIPSTFTSEGSNIFIQPPTENYIDGTYTLYITSKLKNKNGIHLKEPIQMIFTIESIEVL
ncbi:Ig-like domain-containing protein [Sporosarcina sp. FSL K6-3457]|uniref:Ig-like domain-containing protein n=1 Tax=Sporosarcina sp. FSL K6-3457 TaxID=2978204 RepID=UPI0030F78C95